MSSPSPEAPSPASAPKPDSTRPRAELVRMSWAMLDTLRRCRSKRCECIVLSRGRVTGGPAPSSSSSSVPAAPAITLRPMCTSRKPRSPPSSPESTSTELRGWNDSALRLWPRGLRAVPWWPSPPPPPPSAGAPSAAPSTRAPASARLCTRASRWGSRCCCCCCCGSRASPGGGLTMPPAAVASDTTEEPFAPSPPATACACAAACVASLAASSALSEHASASSSAPASAARRSRAPAAAARAARAHSAASSATRCARRAISSAAPAAAIATPSPHPDPPPRHARARPERDAVGADVQPPPPGPGRARPARRPQRHDARGRGGKGWGGCWSTRGALGRPVRFPSSSPPHPTHAGVCSGEVRCGAARAHAGSGFHPSVRPAHFPTRMFFPARGGCFRRHSNSHSLHYMYPRAILPPFLNCDYPQVFSEAVFLSARVWWRLLSTYISTKP